MKKRLNIGLMISHLDDSFGKAVCRGAIIGAKEIDANLIVLPGRYINGVYDDTKRTEYEYQYNTLFSYADKESIDVLLVLIGAFASSLSTEKKQEFLKQYDGIPVITLASEVPGYPYVCFDNTNGLKECIEHIIKVHNRKRIGFISGPKTNGDANERLNTYKETMIANGFEYDENLVEYGRFSPYSRNVVETLLNRNPDLDGLIFANDAMALGAYDVFEERGIKIGVDISVTGFDDIKNASTVSPPLTTVRADASELGYSAVIECMKYAESGEISSHFVNSSITTRKSCGCLANKKSSDNTNEFNNIECVKNAKAVSVICDYLFGTYKSGEEVIAIRSGVSKLLNKLFEKITAEDDTYILSEETADNFKKKFEEFFDEEAIKYIEHEKICEVINFLKTRISSRLKSESEKFILCEMTEDLYRRITAVIINYNSLILDEMEFLRWQSNSIAKDMLMFDSYDDSSYGSVTDKLVRLHMNSSYLYLFENTLYHYKDDEFALPPNILLKSYHNNEKVEVLPPDEQIIGIPYIFNNRYMPDDRRYTMVVSPIFVNASYYGIFVCELEYEYFYYINSLTAQLCAAMKIIRLIQDKEGIRLKLEESLNEIQEKNLQLDVMAKIDELTGVYNRRGFFVQASSIIFSPMNEHKKAIVVFGDVNYLKTINDKFGHEDGDFAIKSSASILCESFRSTDVIGRIGGDEFAVLALVDGYGGVAEEERVKNQIRERILKATNNFNEAHNKPYVLNISIGIYEFTCSTEVDLHDILSKADALLYEEKAHKPPLFR